VNVMSTYAIVVEPDEDGGYFVVVPALPGCFTRGDTVEECRERAVEAIEVHIAGLRADGEPVPEEAATRRLPERSATSDGAQVARRCPL
jgi:antitoxin HicB